MEDAFFGSAGPAVEPGSRHLGEDIVVQSLSVSQWRVCDRRWSDHDARSVLGFIEKKDDLFEVMQLTDGFEWFSFTSLSAATAHFTETTSSALVHNENLLSRLRAHS